MSETIFEYDTPGELKGRENCSLVLTIKELEECIDGGLRLMLDYIAAGEVLHAGGYAQGLFSNARELERRRAMDVENTIVIVKDCVSRVEIGRKPATSPGLTEWLDEINRSYTLPSVVFEDASQVKEF